MEKKNAQLAKEKEKKGSKGQSAEEIAEIMVENMKANMQNPKFLDEQELLRDKVRRKVIKERKARETRQN